jgi:hypothetical protein
MSSSLYQSTVYGEREHLIFQGLSFGWALGENPPAPAKMRQLLIVYTISLAENISRNCAQ